MEMLKERQRAILDAVVRAYTESAVPVSSLQLAERLPFSVSSATVRSEMAVLEREGYLAQPHSSAGRVPTASAFRFAVAERLQRARGVKQRCGFGGEASDVAQTAAALAERVGIVAYVASGGQFALSGFSFVAAMPEFRAPAFIGDFGRLIDRAAAWQECLLNALEESLDVFIGDENPILQTEHFSIVALRSSKREVVAVLGPLRMDYDRVLSVLVPLA